MVKNSADEQSSFFFLVAVVTAHSKSVFDTKSDNDSSFSNTQCKKFISYVKEVVANFKETGSLRGISTIAREYGVSSLTKEQFFRYGLNNDGVTDEYIISVYEKAKKHL